MAENVIELKVEGLREAVAKLDEFRVDMRTKVVYGALRDGAKPMVRAASAFAATLTRAPLKHSRSRGTISRNVKVFRSKKFRGQDDTIGVYITVKASKADLKRAPVSGDPFYWRWVEGGHAIVPRSSRVGTRNGKALNKRTIRARRAAATGTVPPYPFLRPAYDQNAAQAVGIVEQRIVARVAKVSQ
jgi:HK97 gp10 family phage protein